MAKSQPSYFLRALKPSDWSEVAELIYLSTNTWYQVNRGHTIFSGGPAVCELFCRVYDQLEPGCGVVAEDRRTGRIIGSCFFHPRETHVSLGIMNVHPNHSGRGVAGALLRHIIAFAGQDQLPVRLVSSAMNLDSFSLYTRHGFTPYATYQDLTLAIPRTGFDPGKNGIDVSRVREANLGDVSAIGALEFEVSGISRERDYHYFIENDARIWQTQVVESATPGELDGFLVSINDPGSRLIGPGVSRDPGTAISLIASHLDRFRGQSPVCLVPADQPALVQRLYGLGFRNCELHFAQVLGENQPVNGIVMPSFMPESG